MIIIDTLLAQRHAEQAPIRVGMIGAGFMGRGVALQILRYVRGIELVSISNRHLDGARRAYREAGAADERIVEVSTEAAMESAVERGRFAITEDPTLICSCERIDVVLEVTGAVEFGADVVERAIAHGKHVVMMNAELDGTVGPILRVRAGRQGVIVTNVDGDQPGVTMNLYRFVRGIGVTPVLCGNIKGLHDPYRNPTTQVDFARRWKQKPNMVASFADGTKISFEQAIIANATGMRVARRGMFGPTAAPGTSIREAAELFPRNALLNGPGIVDYVVGAEPAPGVFVLGTCDHPAQQHYLSLYKLGDGPLYCFHTPYHLCHFEVPNTIARAALLHDATITPLGAPAVDVVATAKVPLTRGSTIDGMGEYMTYGQAENHDVSAAHRLLPMGLAAGCTLRRDLPKDAVLTYDDVTVPPNRLCDRLRAEQDRHFGATTPAAAPLRT